MEMIEIIWQAIYVSLLNSIIVWPVITFVFGLYLLFTETEKLRKPGMESVVVAITLGVIVVLIQIASVRYGLKAAPYQHAAAALYYLILVVWIIRTVMFFKNDRKLQSETK